MNDAPATRLDLPEAGNKKMRPSTSAPWGVLAMSPDSNRLRAAERGIPVEAQRPRDDEWLVRNQPAIDACNARIEREGLLGDAHRNV